MRTDEDISKLPDDLCTIIEVLGQKMGERRLTPELVTSTVSAWSQAIPGHEVNITHGDRNGPDAHHFVIEIFGDRWGAQGSLWRFRSGMLERLCRKAASAK